MHSKLHSHFLTQVRNTSEVALQHELLKARDAARRAEDRANRALKAKVRGEGKLETLLQRALKAKVRGEGKHETFLERVFRRILFLYFVRCIYPCNRTGL